MKLYCGIDLGNESTALCVVDEGGKIVFEDKVDTDERVILKTLRRYKGMRCVVEAAPLAEWLCVVVEKAKHDVQIIDPRQAKVVTHSKKKTDKIDARKLAQLCRTGWYTVVHRKSGQARGLRSYMIARKQLTDAHGALKSCIRGLFRAHGIRLPQAEGEEFVALVRASVKDVDGMLKRAVLPLLAA